MSKWLKYYVDKRDTKEDFEADIGIKLFNPYRQEHHSKSARWRSAELLCRF
jgi:hypothetical protein